MSKPVVHKFNSATKIWKPGYFIGSGFTVDGYITECKLILHGTIKSAHASKSWSKVTCKKCLHNKPTRRRKPAVPQKPRPFQPMRFWLYRAAIKPQRAVDDYEDRAREMG